MKSDEPFSGRPTIEWLHFIEPESFRIYLYWLYRGIIAVQGDTSAADTDMEGEQSDCETEEEKSNEEEVDEELQLGKAYVLGVSLWDETFQDAIIDAIIAKAKENLLWKQRFLGRKLIIYIYKDTDPDSAARRLIAELCVHFADEDWLNDGDDDVTLPRDFLRDVSMALMINRKKSTLQNPEMAPEKPGGSQAWTSQYGDFPDTCTYHKHPLGVNACYRNSLSRSCWCP
jgi:hypothetical protein